MGSRIDMQTHAGKGRRQHSRILARSLATVRGDVFRNRVTLTFDFWVNAWLATTIEYTDTEFGVDSSSRFPIRAWSKRCATECPTHAGGYTGVGNK